jgi:hypothetical protein
MKEFWEESRETILAGGIILILLLALWFLTPLVLRGWLNWTQFLGFN